MSRDLGLGHVQRVVFAGDWHMNTAWARRAIQWAGRIDGVKVILHTGDFGYTFGKGFLRVVSEAAEEAAVVVAFVDGNHEDFDWLYAQPVDDDGVRRLTPWVWHLPRGLRWEWSGQRFLALGGAVSVDQHMRHPGLSWWPQETLTSAQATAAIDGGLADVMITHDCPSGVKIPGLDGVALFPPHLLRASDQHRELLGEVVRAVKPYLLVHGHYHRRYSANMDDQATHVIGLDCDGSDWMKNMEVLDLSVMEGIPDDVRG